ncbi:hypothetical protein KSP39_PZI014339 [Platanthera zijinensis]|uniref:Uncharacterized protein n=1 Tax=Platanthera zijinensis TaxID=2320716 RepID=A0AAP0G2B6_9ASPA
MAIYIYNPINSFSLSRFPDHHIFCRPFATLLRAHPDGMPDNIEEYYRDKDGNLPLPYHLRPKPEYNGFQKMIKRVPRDLSDDDQLAFAFCELFTPSKYLVPNNYDENAAAKELLGKSDTK